MQCAKIIDVLNRIVEHQRLQPNPRSGEMYGQEERKSSGPSLAAAKYELWVEAIADFQAQEPANVTPDAVFNAAPVGVRSQSLIDRLTGG
jgi:hypothetical protein